MSSLYELTDVPGVGQLFCPVGHDGLSKLTEGPDQEQMSLLVTHLTHLGEKLYISWDMWKTCKSKVTTNHGHQPRTDRNSATRLLNIFKPRTNIT